MIHNHPMAVTAALRIQLKKKVVLRFSGHKNNKNKLKTSKLINNSK